MQPVSMTSWRGHTSRCPRLCGEALGHLRIPWWPFPPQTSGVFHLACLQGCLGGTQTAAEAPWLSLGSRDVLEAAMGTQTPKSSLPSSAAASSAAPAAGAPLLTRCRPDPAAPNFAGVGMRSPG